MLKLNNYFIFIVCSILSIAIFFSFRVHLIEDLNSSIILSFIIFEIMVWSYFIFKKKLLILSNSLFFLALINLLTTPINYLLTFDLPYNPPNTVHIKDYKNANHFKDIFFGKHKISFDHMTYRTNKEKKINYNKKDKDTLRIFTIGGSTTAQVTLDDKKTWSTLLGGKMEAKYKKNIEVVNTGVLGFAASYHFLTLKKIEQYNPDLIIFLVGINDWNNHIVRKRNYFFSNFEINYNVKNSILYKGFKNIKKQIKRKVFNKNNKKTPLNNKNSTEIFFNNEKLWTKDREYLSQMGSSNSKKIIKKFQPKNVSDDYNFWISKLVKNCKNKKFTCIFMDQPNAYQKNISTELKSRLWMTPLFKDYALPFNDLVNISALYNNWLKKKITENNLNFVNLSSNIPPDLNYFFDDVHFTENGSIKVSEILFNYIMANINVNKL